MKSSWFRPLLARVARWHQADDAESVVGDFDEHFARAAAQRGRLRAESIYLRELAMAALWTFRDRLRRTPPEPSPGRFDMIRQDIRYAIRSLTSRWRTTTIALVVIALGVGLNVSMFAVVRATVLSPFPFPESDRLRVLLGTYEAQGWTHASLSIPELLDYAERSPLIDEVGITRSGVRMALAGDGVSQKVEGTLATSAYFRVLQTPPLLGRTFLPEEDSGPGAHPVVILAHSFWQSQFAGAPDVLGRSIRLSGRDYEVVGIMPPGFVDVANGFTATDLWAPLTMGVPFLGSGMYETRGGRQYAGLLRVPAGVDPVAVQAELDRVAAELAIEYPDQHESRGVTAWTLDGLFFAPLVAPLRILLGGALLVLLICCANVAAMLLVQTRERRPELAVRSSLGARRVDLVRQLLTESLLLAAVGGGFGLLLASWTVGVGLRVFSFGLPTFANVAVDTGVLSATALLVIAAGLLFGLVPALRFTRAAATTLDSGSSRGATPRRSGWTVVAVETAVAALLLVGAGLAAKDLVALTAIPTGFETENMLTAQLDLTRGTDLPTDPNAAAAAEAAREEERVAFAEELTDRLSGLPGVRAVGMIGPDVLGNANWHIRLAPPGEEGRDPSRWPLEQRLVVTPGTLEAIGVELLRGRYLLPSDRAGSELVALIDEQLATGFFGSEEPVGRVLTASNGNGYRVVGVVENARHRGRLTGTGTVAGDVYLSYLQSPWTWVSIAARTSGEEAGVVAGLRRIVSDIDPDVVLDDVAWLEDRLRRRESIPRLVATLASTYALIAALLAFVGTYGVLAYSVRSRAREIAVQSALGSPRARILGRTFTQGIVPAATGMLGGLLAAALLARPMAAILNDIDAFDPVVYAATALVLIVASAAASWIPARRAARIDPMETLRREQ